MTTRSLVHRSRNSDTHGHFCLILGNTAIFTNSSMLISKIIVATLNSCVKEVFLDFRVLFKKGVSFSSLTILSLKDIEILSKRC